MGRDCEEDAKKTWDDIMSSIPRTMSFEERLKKDEEEGW